MSNRNSFAMGLLVGLVAALSAYIMFRSPEVALADTSTPAEGMAIVPAYYDSNQQMILVLDPATKHLLMYDHHRGTHLSLKSVRNLTWDMQIPEEFHTRTDDSEVGSSNQKVNDIKKAAEEFAKKGEKSQGGGTK